MGLRELSDVLWRERQLIDLLSYRLEAERLVDGAGLRWAPQATREVTETVIRLRLAEVERAALSADVAVSMGLDALAPLKALSAKAPEPWAGILVRHHEALLRATAEVVQTAGESRQRLENQMDEVKQVLDVRTVASEGSV